MTTLPTPLTGCDWDAFEARVAAHKQAVARVVRVEDQLIELMRERDGTPTPDEAGRFGPALDEARREVWATAVALFPGAGSEPYGYGAKTGTAPSTRMSTTSHGVTTTR